jgi:hypothetical protein
MTPVTPTLIVSSLRRSDRLGRTDELPLSKGVNVLVGPPNAGKTKWLEMLDFVMGDTDSPEKKLGELAEKYIQIAAECSIAGKPVIIERRWHESTDRFRVYVDGQGLNLKEYHGFLMSSLELPIVHYPQGDPLSPRTWPELNWRSLYRHLYRRQHYWADIADRQFQSEQHASLLEFLGLANRVFSTAYEDLVSAQKEVAGLRVQKEEYMRLLNELSAELLEQEDLGVAVTSEGIGQSIERLKAEIASVQDERKQLLQSLAENTSTGGSVQFEELSSKLGTVERAVRASVVRRRHLDTRLADIQAYRSSVQDEASRLERADVAAQALAGVQITHCPACDQEVAPATQPGICSLCMRPIPDDAGERQSRIRLQFEQERLESELHESDDLAHQLQKQLDSEIAGGLKLQEDRQRIRELLRPVRSRAAAILPPDVAILDMKTGQLQQRIHQLESVRSSLRRRSELGQAIAEIEKRILKLEATVDQLTRGVDFESAADEMYDGMNRFLNEIKRRNPNSWTVKEIGVRVESRFFQFTVGGRSWSQSLGGTLRLYFLLAYHYALLRLTNRPGRRYPGLVVLDFPPELEDGTSIADKENFVLEPFVDLLEQEGFPDGQVIAAGSSFQGLEGANRIELSHVWS